MAALAVAYYGLMVDLNENYSSNNGLGRVNLAGYNRVGEMRMRVVRDLVSATRIILWAASLMILGLAVWTWVRRRGNVVRIVNAPWKRAWGWEGGNGLYTMSDNMKQASTM